MNRRHIVFFFCAMVFLNGSKLLAAGPKLSEFFGDNKHNLSSRHPRTTGFKADSSDPRGLQICIFCHTPHNATAQLPLWNRNLSSATFGHYSSQTLVISHTSAASFNEPTGSSRLCLSCHDGVTAGGIALGKIVGSTQPIPMTTYGDTITGNASFTVAKVKTGHHPVSFVYDSTVLTAIDTSLVKAGQGYKLPILPQVKLDKESRMQCTTCHNPHQNQSEENRFFPSTTRKIAPFWVYGGSGNAVLDHDTVCKECHDFATAPWAPAP